jgi:flagellar assembly factor FliW
MRALSTRAVSIEAGGSDIDITLADGAAHYSRCQRDPNHRFGRSRVSALALETLVDSAELTFESGLPGFPDAHRFTLVPYGDGDSPFSIMRSLDREGLEFVVMPPSVFFPDYVAELDDVTAARLDLGRDDDVLVLVMLTLGDTAADATANLLGPVVVNPRTNLAAQAVVSDTSHDWQTPLVKG